MYFQVMKFDEVMLDEDEDSDKIKPPMRDDDDTDNIRWVFDIYIFWQKFFRNVYWVVLSLYF